MSYGRITPYGFIPADQLGDFSDTPVERTPLKTTLTGELEPNDLVESGRRVRPKLPPVMSQLQAGDRVVKPGPCPGPMKEVAMHELGFVGRLVLNQLQGLSALDRRAIFSRFNPDGTSK